MPLDIAIFDQPEKNYLDYLPLSISIHTNLIQLSKKLNLTLIYQMSEYYSDVEYSIDKLHDLKIEIENLLQINNLNKDTKNFLENFKKLLIKAQELKKPISVVAD